MWSKTPFGDFDPKRLRRLLALVFFALAAPTAVLIWQAYGQLKWESFHQYRGMAEELTGRIDARLIELIDAAEARSFTDYSFLVVAGDLAGNLLERSALAELPVSRDFPGLIGYFQVDTQGDFSTPILPQRGLAPERVGIAREEYGERLEIAAKIQQILADNRLVRARPTAGRRLGFDDRPGDAEEERPDTYLSREQYAFQKEAAVGAQDAIAEPELKRLQPSAPRDKRYGQQAFDELSNAPQAAAPVITGLLARDADESPEQTARANVYGKIADLKLDSTLQRKSQGRQLAAEEHRSEAHDATSATIASRSRRAEHVALPETVAMPESAATVASADGERSPITPITTFASELDPYQFSMLNSGHFVLFRKAWRESERYTQGLLIDQRRFFSDVIEVAFRETALSAMSNLIIGYHSDVIAIMSGTAGSSYPLSADEMTGTLFHRDRLSAPLGSLELIFSITHLPSGPGASVLGWTTAMMALVFLGGFFALYHLGLTQIRLARQQQDFVSAVSHELKTPLTSIRMYGEMLKEGWVTDEKRARYYAYIHNESERLTRLISNVLQLAKITRNEPQLDLQRRTVGELMDLLQSKVVSQAQQAGFELRLGRDTATDRAVVNIDEDCFAQIIINLVDNAIKFSKEARIKSIELASTTTGDHTVTFVVRDYGPGVPRDQMTKIFQLFYRSETELTRETVGTGIGLAIVRQLTIAMHGTVDVINRAPGAEFRVTFARVPG